MKAILRLATAIGIFAAAGGASATVLAPLTTEQKVDAADAIVQGRVTGVTAVLDHGVVWTRADIEVETVLKGAPPARLVVESAGGVLNGEVYEVDAAARYAVDEDVVLFLSSHPSRGTWGTVGMALGKYTVRQDPATGGEMVVQYTVPYTRAWDPRFIPHPAVADRVGLDTFEDGVRARVALGWDGKPIPGISSDRLLQINRLQPGVR
jgi:hypothetical protein